MGLEEIKDLIIKAKESNATTLDLSSKGLTSLPSEIEELKNLTELNISNNQLTYLPSKITKLKNLARLDIYNNKLILLPPEIAELKNLIELNMSNNQLTSLPSEIAELKNLTKLYMSNNQLTSLPPEIAELKNLTRLDIAYNRLTSLPPEITELKNLRTFHIYNNQLTSLPQEIAELKNLTGLYINNNQLTSLPPEIAKLKNLTRIDMYNNRLISLPLEIAELNNLTRLDIYNNRLLSLPPEIAKLKNLTRLDISDNQLTSLQLEIAELKNLTRLDISDNQLTSLPPEIAELKNLTRLDISNNQLTSLPPEILKLGLDFKWKYQLAEEGIFLHGNPFENPPVEILKQSREAILNYFKSEGEKKPLNEVKVLLVGDGGAGKTSLVKRLFREEVDGNEPQTQGINIRKWTVNNGDREVKANFWDFGGQEIMHATHQFFLSKRSLYILVLDGRKNEKPEYWLKLIENFGGDSPILVVINKIDENPSFELNRKFLRGKYSSIRGFYRLSCKSGEGVEEFLKILEEELKTVKHLEIKWPKSWFNVKSRLEKIRPSCAPGFADEDKHKNCSFIQYNEYKTMCDKEGINSESEQDTLVDFLHDLGVILHFRDIPLLNTHVLEPEWVTNAVYRVINSREIADSKGILKPNDMLPKILRQNSDNRFYYPPDQYGFVINLMKKFELSYDLNGRTMLLPSLLEIQEPNFEFKYEGSLRFVIDYDFLPPSVMPRFIVKMSGDIKDDLRWRTGVVLQNKGFSSIAVVRADNEARKISIDVNGRQKRDYLAVILQRFREINSSFEKLKAIEKIPLPDESRVAVSYEHLINLELMGHETYMPEGSYKEYKVSDLLGTVTNKSSLIEMIEEILRNTERNYNSYLEILDTLREIQEVDTGHDTEETLLEKLTGVIEVNPSLFGVTLKLNEVIKLYLKWRRKT